MDLSQPTIYQPHVYEAVFPIIAFVMVVLVPCVVALWVIYKTLTEKRKQGEQEP